MGVAVGIARVDAGHLHGAPRARVGRVVLGRLDRALELAEVPTDRGDHEVLHLERHARVGGIHVPRAGRDADHAAFCL